MDEDTTALGQALRAITAAAELLPVHQVDAIVATLAQAERLADDHPPAIPSATVALCRWAASALSRLDATPERDHLIARLDAARDAVSRMDCEGAA